MPLFITQGGAGVVFFLIRKSSFDRIATYRIDISVKELLNRLVKDPQKCLTERNITNLVVTF
jgi:hypothetical protein